MGFEQYNFSNWTGSSGSVTIGSPGGNPSYNIVNNSIANSAGDNVSVINPDNFHTIMTNAAINPLYPSCTGYDSLACKAVGTQTISEIPFVSPYSFDPVSVRLNSANAGKRAARLKYITTSSSVNKRVSFSFAVIFQNPISQPHLPEEAPYFSVIVKNEATGQLLPGCSSVSFNPKLSSASDSIKNSAISDFYPKISMYERRPETMKLDFAGVLRGLNKFLDSGFASGPSSVSREKMLPTPPLAWKLRLLPSLDFTSSVELNRPP